MSATIVQDDGGGPVTGTIDNGTLAATVNISNFSDTGVLGWLWELVYRPPGSAAVIAAINAAATSFSPDVRGTYLFRLTTFTDAARTVADDTDEQCYAVRLEDPFDWRLPAAGETRQFDATAGWAPARDEAIRDLRANLLSKPISAPVTLVAATTYTLTAGGLLMYNPASSSGTATIEAPATPALGDRWAIKNVTVDATTVAVDGNGNSIEDPNTSTIIASYNLVGALVSLDYLYDGTNWIII